ncbi:MAG: hypothetical protein U0136_13695 [Bdellovibrionota bacterium]
MSNTFFKYNLASGASQVGDWLRILALNWVVVDTLGGTTTHNLLRSALGMALTISLSLLPLRKLDIRLALVSSNLFSAVTSGLLAFLLFTDQLTFAWIFGIEMMQAVFSIGSGPASASLIRDIGGEQQRTASFHTFHWFWFARVAAGLITLPLAPFGAWTMLGLDALSYLPLVAFIVSLRSNSHRGGELEYAVTHVDWRKGVRALLSNTRHVLVLGLTLLQNYVGALSFWTASELIRRKFDGDLNHVCIWVSVTGCAALFGNLVAAYLVKRFHSWCERMYFVSFFVVQVAMIGIGLSGEFTTYVCFYVLSTLFVPTLSSISNAYFQSVDRESVAHVSRAKGLADQLMYCLQLCLCSALFVAGLSSGAILAGSALFALLLLVSTLVFASIFCRSLFQPWFTAEGTTGETAG